MDEIESPPKKGLGPLAWAGIGCGGIILLAIIGLVIFSLVFGGKIKEFAAEAQKNPTRATANALLVVPGMQLEMVAEDDAAKRYTLRDKQTGKFTTVYWLEREKKVMTIDGDFSAIPADPPAPK